MHVLSSLACLQHLDLSFWPAGHTCPPSLQSLVSVASGAQPQDTPQSSTAVHCSPWLAPCLTVHALTVQTVSCDADGPPTEEVDLLLQPLTHLTGLALSFECVVAPASLARLSRLQWLYLHTQSMSDDALPAGSWTHSLRRLAVEYDVAEASVPQLTQASHLSHLSLLNLP